MQARSINQYGGLVALVVLAGLLLPLATVGAAEATPERLSVLREQCSVLKTRLTAVQKIEAADRIKRGRAYDQDLLPYISAFNSRVAANQADAPELIRIAAELQRTVGRSQFGSQYSVYTDDLTSAINSDCRNNPEILNDWLDKARLDRATLSATVKKADALVSEYISELEKLEQRYAPVINQPEQENSQ